MRTISLKVDHGKYFVDGVEYDAEMFDSITEHWWRTVSNFEDTEIEVAINIIIPD